jgi:hypothetical protein
MHPSLKSWLFNIAQLGHPSVKSWLFKIAQLTPDIL